MAKRFTATEKWSDSWFRVLPPLHKLGWLYLCDTCDAAGVIDLDRDLANFQLGDTLDWDALIEVAKGRIELLPNGKLWLTRFITFQFGELSETCMPHRAALKSIEKNQLPVKTQKGNKEGLLVTLKDKDKDKDKEKSGKGDARGKPIEAADVLVPDGFDIPELHEALEEWLKYKAKRGEAYRDVAYIGRKVAEFQTPQLFISAVFSSIGNNYAGIFPPKHHGPKPTTRSKRYQG